MSTPLAVGNGLIGGGGITYTYTDFELTATIGDGTIDAPDINISLSAQTAALRTGSGTIGAGLPTLAFDDYSAELVTGTGTIGAGETQIRDIVRALFPALSPSDRSFEPPEYALSKYKAMNGAKSRRLWASQPGGGTLDLLFENIDDDDAESILAAHDVAKGAGNDVILPDTVLSGAEGDLLAYMRSPGGQAWSFDAPPEVESIKEGMSTVRVKLSARRKVQFNSVGSVGGTFAVGAAPVDEIDPISFDDCDFVGRAAEQGPNPRPGALWVSRLAAGGAYSIGDSGNVEWGPSGNSYHVLKVASGGTRLAIVKRNRAGGVLWQRVSQVYSDFGHYFYDIKPLANGGLLVLAAGVALFGGTVTQRLLLFSGSGILLRSRSFEMAGTVGIRVRDLSSAQIWAFTAFGSGAPRLITLSIADDSTFGDTLYYYSYDSASPSGFTGFSNLDVRPLPNGNIFMLATFTGAAYKHHCLELSPSGETLVQVAAFTDSPTNIDFKQAIPLLDGSIVLAAEANKLLRISSTFEQIWYKSTQTPGNGMYAGIDALGKFYYSYRGAGGVGSPEPAGWTAAGPGSPWVSGGVAKLSSDFSATEYGTWSACGVGDNSAAYSYLGTNSGIDFVNGRFIGCAADGNNVTAHALAMPSGVTTAIVLPGGGVAKAATQYVVDAPTAETSNTVTRSVPTMTITAQTLSYTSESWSFTDPGDSMAWDLFIADS